MAAILATVALLMAVVLPGMHAMQISRLAVTACACGEVDLHACDHDDASAPCGHDSDGDRYPRPSVPAHDPKGCRVCQLIEVAPGAAPWTLGAAGGLVLGRCVDCLRVFGEEAIVAEPRRVEQARGPPTVEPGIAFAA